MVVKKFALGVREWHRCFFNRTGDEETVIKKSVRFIKK